MWSTSDIVGVISKKFKQLLEEIQLLRKEVKELKELLKEKK